MSGTLALRRTYQEARWTDDLDPNGAETDSDFESLQQDVMHVLLEDLGTNMADPDSGIGILNYLNGTVDALRQVPRMIDTQMIEDPRITSSETTMDQMSDGSFLITINIQVGTDIISLQFALGPNGLSIVNT